MKLALALVLGAVCVYVLLRKPQPDPRQVRFEMWRELERVDSV